LEPSELTAVAYAATLALLGVYGLHRLVLLVKFRWLGTASAPLRATDGGLPRLTVQLPVYNERTVAARLIRAAGALEYPADRLEIQVLDDSSDETRRIVDEEVAALRTRGVDAVVVRRADRRGFKAGALDHGMKSAKGELIAIFDADFEPAPDFLLQLVDQFQDPKVGMVQARWGHSNRSESLLTRAESALLDGHFVIEHTVRHQSGVFFNFNGTAGIWRRAAVESAGGWEHDTLTEDLDLSYRAQLHGWRFVYLPMVVAPAEVPPDIAAFKSQQHRWAKGSVQVFRKLGWRILTSDEPLQVKLEAMAHLTGNVGYPAVLLLAVLLPLAAGLKPVFPSWLNLALFVTCTLAMIAFYNRSQSAVGRSLGQRIVDTFAALALGIGMCVSQTRAVFEGLMPGTGVFVRTPKRGDARGAKRYVAAARGLPGIELVLAGWFVWGIAVAIERENWTSLPFLALFLVSFAWVGTLSLVGAVRNLWPARAQSATA
jgi:cellulose synthase/poly-beta-1,6-N-acetylglucosamine synthase-like glycosyltransferase